MNEPARWQRVQDIFEKTLDSSPEQRHALSASVDILHCTLRGVTSRFQQPEQLEAHAVVLQQQIAEAEH